jgi:hypothetical protein
MLQIKSFGEFFSYFVVTQRFWIFCDDTTKKKKKLRGGAEFGSGCGGRCFDIGVYCKL